MAAATLGPWNLPADLFADGATITAYPVADNQRDEPRSAAITTAVVAAEAVTLSHANLVAGTWYRAIGNKPGGGTRVAFFLAA